MSLTVDISLAQVALITGETAELARRLFPNSRAMQDLSARIERFLSARADTLEARMYAGEVIAVWQKLQDSVEHRELLVAHRRLRGLGKQDHVVQRLRQLAAALKAEAQPLPRIRRTSSRRRSLAG